MYSTNEISDAGGGGHLAFRAQPYRGREYRNCIGDEQKGDSWGRGKLEWYSKSQRPELFFGAYFRLVAKLAALGEEQK